MAGLDCSNIPVLSSQVQMVYYISDFECPEEYPRADLAST